MAQRGDVSRKSGVSRSLIAWIGAAAWMFASGCATIWNFSELEPSRRDDASTDVPESGTIADSTVRDARIDAGTADGSLPGLRDANVGDDVVADALPDRNLPDGGCLVGCPTGTACDNGSCVCQTQPDLCGSQCVDLLTNHDHCGACANVCPIGAACTAGTCKCPVADPDTCARISGDAGARCVNVLTDHGNCGACNNGCAATSACHNGVCTICGTSPTDRQCDGGICIDTASDTLNCGACNHECPAGATCVSGTCPCPSGLRVCGPNPGACVDVTNGDPNNCGACGHICSLLHAASSCSVSSCIIFKCNLGFTDCDRVPSNGCEVHTAADPSNCGSCGHACMLPHTVPHCTAGTCVATFCSPGYMDCDKLNANGCEVRTDTDVNNCGACGHVCTAPAGATATCVGGVCACVGATCPCSPPTTRCGSACVNTSSDPANCGACSHACPTPTGGSVTCVGSACVGNCSMAGYTACPAVDPTACVNLQTDNGNCGSCGQTCGTPAGSNCALGACACPARTTLCNAGTANAACVSLLTDPNCGACGYNCSLVTGGVCVAGSCIPPLLDAGPG